MCIILSAFSSDPLNGPVSSEQALKYACGLYVYAGGFYEVRMQDPSWLYGAPKPQWGSGP